MSKNVEVQIKKHTSLTKKKIDLSRVEKSNSVGKAIVSSARKLFSDAWSSLTSPGPQKSKLKIK